MGRAVYFVSGGAGQNVNGQWFSNFIQGNSREIKYVGYGVAAAVSIYILLPSVSSLIAGKDMFASQSKRSDRTTTGLFNNRNDCFANSSVQALSALPSLTRYLNGVLEQASQISYQLLRGEKPSNENGKPNTAGSSSSASVNKIPGESREQQQHPRGRLHHLSPPQYSAGVVTPKVELEQNPLDVHFENQNGRPGLSALKSTATVNTISTLKDEDEGDETSESRTDKDHESSVNLPKLPLHRSLASMLEQLHRTTSFPRTISVWPLLHSLEVIFNARISSGQNDAHELTQVILERLQKENNSLRDFIKDENLSITVPEIPFRGNLADHLVCTACRNSSKVKVTQFNMLSLSVPQAISAKLAEMVSENQVETIEGYSCLTCKVGRILENEKNHDRSKYGTSEQNILSSLTKAFPNMAINDDLSQDLTNYINDYNKDGLITSQLKSSIVKKNIVVGAPQVLLIHLSRSMFNGTSYIRNPCAVVFDEVLHLQEQVIENNKCVGINNVAYELKAIIKHTGSHSQGHYQCYRHKPDFVKDIDTHAVINRSPVIDATLINIHDPQDSKEVAATEMMEPPPPSQSFNNVTKSSNGPRSLSNPTNDNDSENYDPDNEDSLKLKIPSRLKKITNFFSGKSSPSSSSSNLTSPNPSDSDNGGNRGRRLTSSRRSSSRPASIVRNSVSRSRASSIVSQAINQPTRSRSRANSLSSMHSYRSSMSSDRSSSDFSEDASPDSNACFTTSASDTDNNHPGIIHRRHLKKIKSVLKYPYWAISDTIIHESRVDEVLNETKYVYMLYYERISS